MGRENSTFRQRDVVAAIRAAQTAGQKVTSFEISRSGSIVVHVCNPADAEPPAEKTKDTWDDVRNPK